LNAPKSRILLWKVICKATSVDQKLSPVFRFMETMMLLLGVMRSI